MTSRGASVIREARESDAAAIREVIEQTYGTVYPYPEFYDTDELRRMILGEDTLTLVAECAESKRIVGTASVLLEIEAYSDLVGEFARLAVRPEARGLGIGGALMKERLRLVRNRLHVGLVEARAVHTYSQRIAQRHGFAPVGFAPQKDQFDRRESTVLLARWFGDALALRNNNPRMIPELHALASAALGNAGLAADVIVDGAAAPYPPVRGFDLKILETWGYSSLLRIERGRTRQREVYGPMRLHYGFFRLRAKDAEYLVARRGGIIAGAIGYMRSDKERYVRIFELISGTDEVIQFLLAEVERRCREEWSTAYLEIEVRGDAPRMQRTLVELGFVPAAYVPAMVFQDVERHDIVKMIRLYEPLDLGPIGLTPEAEAIAAIVLEPLRDQQRLACIEPVIHAAGIFHALTEEQAARLASICTIEDYDAGATIIAQGRPGSSIFIVLEGTAQIHVAGEAVGAVGPTEVLGEMGLLKKMRHSATAIAQGQVQVARIAYADINALIRRRPDIGVAVYRNLAAGLGRKLTRAGRE